MRTFLRKILVIGFTLFTHLCFGVLSWDGSNTTDGHSPTGGTGPWDLATKNWSGPSPSFIHQAWPPAGDVGIFAGTAGTVNLATGVNFTGLQFSTTGYLISGANTLTVNPPSCNIITDAGVSATISSNINGSANSLRKVGPGTLTLSGTNTFANVFSVDAGTVNITGLGKLTNSFDTRVGDTTGNNQMGILSGGQVTSTNQDFVVGNTITANGNSLIVQGIGSQLSVQNGNTFYIGQNGNSNSLTISQGGKVSVNKNSRIGHSSSSNGNTALVTGAGSLWSTTESFFVGRTGPSNTLTVELGGQLNVGSANISSSLTVGYNSSNNQMTIQSGGQVNLGTNLFIGDTSSASTNNSVLVTDVGTALTLTPIFPSLKLTGGIVVGVYGTNTSFTVRNNASVTAPLGIAIAAYPGSSGTFQIGTGGAPGQVTAAQIGPGQGIASLVFNHNSPNYFFSPVITGDNFLTYINGILAVLHEGPGQTTLAANNTYKGILTIDLGTVVAGTTNALSPSADIIIIDGGELNLGGFNQTVPNVLNDGLLDFGGNQANTQLSVTNDYAQIGNGTLIINALNATPTNWGQLVVTNLAIIGGDLELNLLTGSSFSNGDEIAIITSGNPIMGAFSSFTVNNLPLGLEAELITTNPNQISVLFSQVVPPPQPPPPSPPPPPRVVVKPPRDLQVERIQNFCCDQVTYTNQLTWKRSKSKDVQTYLIYRNGKKIASVPADKKLVYDDQNQDRNVSTRYKVFAVNNQGKRSKPAVAELERCVISKCIKCRH